jgi:antitoxin HicB
MSLPKTLEEWERLSPAWAEKARRMIPEGGYTGPRRRPRDPGERRVLRDLGVDRQKPFGLSNLAADAALMIRMARKRAGISQAQLARRMGVTQQQVQRLEDPDRANPTVTTLRAVATALGLEVRIRFE